MFKVFSEIPWKALLSDVRDVNKTLAKVVKMNEKVKYFQYFRDISTMILF